MTRDEISATLAEALGRIAPETDLTRIDRNGNLREEFDIDSMDFLNFVTALAERLSLDIPERDYRRLATFAAAEDYLAEKLGISG
jgi:acyl carrier protein